MSICLERVYAFKIEIKESAFRRMKYKKINNRNDHNLQNILEFATKPLNFKHKYYEGAIYTSI